MKEKPLISIRDLYKNYGDKQVLKGINLDIYKGETLVILGRSGVGKSVLLRQIIGIEKPDSGSIFVEGKEITEMSGHHLFEAIQSMGMLFQASALFDSMSVAENTAFYLKENPDIRLKRHLKPSEIKERVEEALALVGLQGTESVMPSELSGGMRKRVALARLIAYHPSILLYDEPTTGLDPITAMQINDLIVTTQRELGATSIVVTHDLCSTFHVATRIALNHDGQIPYIAKKEDFARIDDPLVKDFLKNSLPEIRGFT